MRARAGRILAAVVIAILICLSPRPAAAALSGRINVNTATAKELARLPFIGPDRARDIVSLRRRHGPFTRPEDLLAAGSIGPLTLAAIRPYIRFRGKSNLKKTTLEATRTIITRPGQVMLLADKELFPVLISLSGRAQRSIHCVMYLFKLGSKKGRAARLVRALIAARRRGVEVRVMLERSDYNDKLNKENRRTAARLKRAGIEVNFDSPRTTTHVKAMVFDHRYTVIGSHNLTGAALGHNHELSLLIDDRELASQVEDYLRLIE